MARSVRLQFLGQGYRDFFADPGTRELVRVLSQDLSDEAGDGFEARMMHGNFGGSPRPIAVVSAKTRAAKRAQVENGALERVLYRGRT